MVVVSLSPLERFYSVLIAHVNYISDLFILLEIITLLNCTEIQLLNKKYILNLLLFLTHTVAQFVKYLVIIITFKCINLSICIQIYCKCKKIFKVHIIYAMFFENIK